MRGKPRGGSSVPDLECPEAIELANQSLPYTGRIHGRKSKPKSHRWQIADPIPTSEKFCDLDGTCLLELRSTGLATVVPPSIHLSGEPIESDGRPSSQVDGGELRKAIAYLAGLTLIARHWPNKREPGTNSPWRFRERCSTGWDDIAVGNCVGAVARTAGDEEIGIPKIPTRRLGRRLNRDATATGRPKLAELFGTTVVAITLVNGSALNPSVHGHHVFIKTKIPLAGPLTDEAFYGLACDAVRTIAPKPKGTQQPFLSNFL